MPRSHVTPNTPVEILETEYPIRVVRHEWLPDTAGAGRYRGGPGACKEYELRADALFTLRMGHQFRHAGWGVLGGQAPPTARATLNPASERERTLGPLETLTMQPGDRIRLELPGGGGYGDPREREPATVLEDVLNGYVSVEAARTIYGVAIDLRTRTVDLEATARLRGG